MQQVKLAVRTLLRERGVSLVAVGSLAFGIAANATIFSLLHAVEFPRLPYPDSSRIVFLEANNEVRGLRGMPVSAPDAMDIAAASSALRPASLTADQSSVLREGASARRIAGRRVTAPFFDVFGMRPALGRTLLPEDGQDRIVLSDRLWRDAFAGDAAVIERPIRLDGGFVTVVGVMPPRFDVDADFWVPLTPAWSRHTRDDRQFSLFARLAPAVSIEAAERELLEISRRLQRDHPATNDGWVTVPVRLARLHGRDSRGAFLLLQAAVVFVLLIACANIANILLARATRRRQEMAVRSALGASRARLVRELLAESVVLSALGGALGILLAAWGVGAASSIAGFPPAIEPTLNLSVLGFASALCILTGLLCGIAPALRASSVGPQGALNTDVRGALGPGRGRLRSVLVAVQIASALVLGVCAGLMGRTLWNRQQVALGVDPRGVVLAELALTGERFNEPASVRGAVDAILGELVRTPGVEAAGAVTWALPTAAGAQRALTLPAEGNASLPPGIRRSLEAVTPGYFAAMGIALTRGRPFIDADDGGAAPVAIVNEELARRLWEGRDPIGQPLRLGSVDEAAPVVTVVGVVSTIRRSAMHDIPLARVYLPFRQQPNAFLSLAVRARQDTGSVARELQAAAGRIEASLFVERVRSMEADLARFLAPIRLITWLLGAFGVSGLLLAGLGVFGTMSYSISQRERELAVRAALGADARAILRLVVLGAMRITGAGVLAGLAASLVATQALESFLYGVTPTDPLTVLVVVAVLVLAAFAACYRPARLAATADPMSILRQ